MGLKFTFIQETHKREVRMTDVKDDTSLNYISGHFTGVWIPVPGDKCLPVSETYSEHRPGADQEVHIRR